MFLTADTSPSKSDRGTPLERKDLGDQTLGTNSGAPVDVQRHEARVYVFTLTPTQEDGQRRSRRSIWPRSSTSTRFTKRTSRAKGSDLVDQAKGAEVHSADDSSWLDTLKQKSTDLSSGRWVYLLILLVLILEQAMAVRLSYHSRPEDLDTFAPSAAAAFSHGTPPPVAAEAEAEATTAGRES